MPKNVLTLLGIFMLLSAGLALGQTAAPAPEKAAPAPPGLCAPGSESCPLPGSAPGAPPPGCPMMGPGGGANMAAMAANCPIRQKMQQQLDDLTRRVEALEGKGKGKKK